MKSTLQQGWRERSRRGAGAIAWPPAMHVVPMRPVEGRVLVGARSRSCDGIREIARPACGRRAAHDLRDQARSADPDAQLTGRLSAAHSPDARADAPFSEFDLLSFDLHSECNVPHRRLPGTVGEVEGDMPTRTAPQRTAQDSPPDSTHWAASRMRSRRAAHVVCRSLAPDQSLSRRVVRCFTIVRGADIEVYGPFCASTAANRGTCVTADGAGGLQPWRLVSDRVLRSLVT
jgi:hypothetical protein